MILIQGTFPVVKKRVMILEMAQCTSLKKVPRRAYASSKSLMKLARSLPLDLRYVCALYMISLVHMIFCRTTYGPMQHTTKATKNPQKSFSNLILSDIRLSSTPQTIKTLIASQNLHISLVQANPFIMISALRDSMYYYEKIVTLYEVQAFCLCIRQGIGWCPYVVFFS